MVQDFEEPILERLMWRGPQTRRSLALASEQSRQTLSRLLFGLERRRIVESIKGKESSGGRKPALLRINPAIGYFLAVNFANGDSTVALADAAFQLHDIGSIPLLLSDGPAKILGEVTKWTKRALLNKVQKNLLGVGISVPGPVDKRSGLLVHPPALGGWDGFSIHEFLGQTFDSPIFVNNDANMMALGELWVSRQGTELPMNECWIIVKLSPDGIGAGIISDGYLYTGAVGGAGEIGHVQVVPNGLRCRCGLRGCLETVAAAPAILQEAQDRSRNRSRRSASLKRPSTAIRDFALAALAGEEIPNSLIQKAGIRIGEVLGTMVNILNPSRILIGGEFATVGPTMLASIRQGVFARALPLMSRQLAVEACRGSRSEIFGCFVATFVELLRKK